MGGNPPSHSVPIRAQIPRNTITKKRPKGCLAWHRFFFYNSVLTRVWIGQAYCFAHYPIYRPVSSFAWSRAYLKLPWRSYGNTLSHGLIWQLGFVGNFARVMLAILLGLCWQWSLLSPSPSYGKQVVRVDICTTFGNG